MANENANASQQTSGKTETGLNWDDYKDALPDGAAKAMYAYICGTAADIIGWYWSAIKNKKRAALLVRGVAFAMLILGAIAQIYTSSVDDAKLRLHYTQGSLALLAIGALLIQGDRSFGWTSGWTRYIMTAMSMDTLFSEFKLKWAKYQVSRTAALTKEDVATLFDLASTLEGQLLKARGEETATWATEFHAGLQLLESAIKIQRETTEKKLDELRATVEKKDDEAGRQAEESRNAQKPGAIEVSLKFKDGPKRVKIALDKGTPEEVLSTSWARLSVTPGHHQLEVTTLGDPPVSISKVIDVTAGSTARAEVQLEI